MCDIYVIRDLHDILMGFIFALMCFLIKLCLQKILLENKHFLFIFQLILKKINTNLQFQRVLLLFNYVII